MDDLQLLLVLMLIIGAPLVIIWSQRREIARLRAQMESQQGEKTAPPQLQRARALEGAGEALAEPPTNLQITIKEMQRVAPRAQYRFPIGWRYVTDHSSLGMGHFVDDTNHILLTGQSDIGKDTWALGVMFSLTQLHNPTEIQICIIDGKGLDFAGWEGKAYTWRLAQRPEDIEPAMRTLTTERLRRADILRNAQVSKWEGYQGGGLPLLVVYISELALLEDATSKSDLAAWMNSELAAGRAFGIRYIVATQTASNFPTRWRSQIGLYVAGYQPADSQDEPNTGRTTKAIKDAGAVPPSELPAPPRGRGVFCVTFDRVAINVRVPPIDDSQRRSYLSQLPERTREPVLKMPDQPVFDLERELVLASSELVLADTNRLEPAHQKIQALAAQGWSRNQIASELGGNRARTLDRIRVALTGTEWEISSS
jgi:hypothetical protein